MGHPKPEYDPVSLSPLSFWSKNPRGRDTELSFLRRERPLSWHPPAEGSMTWGKYLICFSISSLETPCA